MTKKSPIQCKIFEEHDKSLLQLEVSKFLNNSEIRVVDVHYAMTWDNSNYHNEALYSFAVFYREKSDEEVSVSSIVQ